MISRHFSQEDMTELLSHMSVSRYEKGNTIVEAHEWSKRIHIVKQGIIALYGMTTGSTGFIHVMYGKDEFFPVGSLGGASGRPAIKAGVVAETNVELYSMPYADFMAFLQEKPERMEAMMKQVVDQFMLYTYQVENLGFKMARERIAYQLLLLGSRFGTMQDNTLQFPRISRATIASAINLRQEVVSREMARLKRLEIIEYIPNKICILDVDRLRLQLGKDAALPFLLTPSRGHN